MGNELQLESAGLEQYPERAYASTSCICTLMPIISAFLLVLALMEVLRLLINLHLHLRFSELRDLPSASNHLDCKHVFVSPARVCGISCCSYPCWDWLYTV